MRQIRRKQHPKRILLAVTANQSLRLLNGFPDYLVTRDWDVHVVSSGPGPAPSPAWSYHRLPMCREPSPIADLLAMARWLLLIFQLRPTLVAAGTPKAGLLGTIAAFILRTPTRIYVLRGLPLSTQSGWRQLTLFLFEQAAMRAATRVQSVSHSLAADVVHRGICHESKITVIARGSSNGVDIPSTTEARVPAAERRVELGLPEKPTIGFVGRIHPDKGIPTLISAFDKICKITEAQLLLIGSEEPSGYLQKCLLGLSGDLHSSVIWAGHSQDPFPYYRSMDVLCLPTKREGFPNVVLEAGAHGVPVVASAVTGCIDAVIDKKTGLLFPEGDSNALAKALLDVVTNTAKRTFMGNQARQLIEGHYAREMIWSETEIFYSQQNTLKHRKNRL